GFLEMAQETHDELGRDAVGGPGLVDRALQSVDPSSKSDAAGEMALWIEEHLDMTQALGMDLGEICHRQVVKVLLGDQDRHALVIEIEKILQPGKLIGLTKRFHARVAKLDAIARGKGEHQFGLQAPLDVDMELAL